MSAAACITVHAPLTIRRHPGRKTIVTPHDQPASLTHGIPARADPAMVKALARAHRWKRLLDEGRYASISEIAAAERIDRGYVGSILRLTLLAPDIVAAILDGQQPVDMGLPLLMEPFPLAWNEQRQTLCGQDGAIASAVAARDRRLASEPSGTSAVPPDSDDTRVSNLEVPLEGRRRRRH